MFRFALALTVFGLATTASAKPRPLSPQEVLQQRAHDQNVAPYLTGAKHRPTRNQILSPKMEGSLARTSEHIWGYPESIGVQKRLASLGPGFEKLAYVPGLVQRMSQFKTFLNARNLRDADPDEALAAFSKSLGSRTVYRALALTDEEAKKVDARGIESGYARSDRDLGMLHPAPRDHAWRPSGFGRDLKETMHVRMLGHGNDDHLVSVSASRDVALSAALPFVKDGRRIHLYKVEIPEIDILKAGNSRSITPGGGRSWLKLTHDDGHAERFAFPAKDTESFVLYRIEKNEIVSHEIVEPSAAPKYSFEFRGQSPAPKN